VRKSRELLVLDEISIQPIKRGAYLTIALLAAVLVVAALGILDLAVAALAGAVALVFVGAVKPEEARKSIDWPVLVLTGGMLSLGRAFDRHGLGEALAAWIARLGDGGLRPELLAVALLAATIALTQVMNNVGTAAIMTPIALSFAAEHGVSDRPLLMAVVLGGSFSFLSPVAHQVNAMVMGPGDYRYVDFLKVGFPLTVGLGVLAAVLLPVFWPLAV
jgi:di/tricarboxylate transporter